MTYGACATTYKTKGIVTAEENKRKLIIANNSGKMITKVLVDNCVVKDNSPRCDYLFEVGSPIEQVIYLELKGCDVEKAYQQLCATIDRFKVSHGTLKKECHIIASRVPKAGPKVQSLKIQLLKDKKAQLFVSTTQHQITL